MDTVFLLLDVLLLQILIINCVNINLDEYNKQYSNTKCKSSLIINKDYFVMKGSVDFSDAGSSWDKTVTVQTRNSSTNDFKEICLISTSATENKVTPDSCYCNDCSGDIKHFTINRTAGMQYSKAEIKVIIQSSDGGLNKNTIKNLPEMISLDKTTSTLSADGKILTHENCWPNSTLTASEIRLCCRSGNEPCTSVIYKNGVKSSGGSCTDVGLISSEIANLTFELEICGEVLQTAIHSCKIEGKTAKDNGPTDYTTRIIVGVLVPTGTIIIIIIIFIFRKKIKTLWEGCFKKKKHPIQNQDALHERKPLKTEDILEAKSLVDRLMAAVRKVTHTKLTKKELDCLEEEFVDILTQKQQSLRKACYRCGSEEHFFHDCPRKAEWQRKQQQGNASSSALDSGCQSMGTIQVNALMAAVHKATHEMLTEEQLDHLEKEVTDILSKKN
ncbi:uncharacterized protein LOC131950132 [Physella acuta]|uniref:uncharacterized protein LOC131950132 n=1 Tax=Physella acuta TaxID=109671 RepID=UPI0027DC4DD4|nr:uncharacterized protein LOC131950132 [Physella acuta]